MTIQEDIILFLSILVGFLIYGFYILKKSLYNHNIKLKEELDDFKIYTRKEFERIRFNGKPICKVGDTYSKKFIVTKVKYFEELNRFSDQFIPLQLLYMTYEYEVLNLNTKELLYFNYMLDFKKFIEINNLTLDEPEK